MSVQARCPACGGPVTFQISTSLVTICPYCQSAVGRSDRGLESLGKVADLVETQSPLDIGIKGKFEGTGFELTGRTQFKHPAGGVWDEWYAAFEDGRWGWLAEAQGRFYLTFEDVQAPDLPTYDQLKLGAMFPVDAESSLLVAEKNQAMTAGARGEIPYRVVPGTSHPFVDLSGPRGEFGTISYEDGKATLYLGRQVTLDELHIPHHARRTYPGLESRIDAVHLNCPRCGAALELRAPDRSERVGCPSCGALSDVNEGKLSLFKSLALPPVEPIIALGAVGKREGVEWTVIGFMQRYVTFEGVDYFWEEYLLYHPRMGFRWLTRSDEHWNWVEGIPPASVRVESNTAYYADRWYRLFQKATARVAFVVGEFYWKVEAGEKVRSRDFVQAPYMLSCEETLNGEDGEINWSSAVYVPKSDIEQMFELKAALPSSTTIGPNQPFPYTNIYKNALVLVSLSVILALVLWFITPRRTIYEATIEMNAMPEGQRTHRVIEGTPIRFDRWKNIRVNLSPRADAGWVHLSGSLVSYSAPPAPGIIRSNPPVVRRDFAFLAIAGQSSYVYLNAVPAGEYTLQLDLAPRNPQVSTTVAVKLEQGVSHPTLLILMIFLLVVLPVGVGMYQVWFESQRWADSNASQGGE